MLLPILAAARAVRLPGCPHSCPLECPDSAPLFCAQPLVIFGAGWDGVQALAADTVWAGVLPHQEGALTAVYSSALAVLGRESMGLKAIFL